MVGYLLDAMHKDRRGETIARAIRDLSGVEFGTIAVRGVSGLLIGPILAERLSKQICVVRKPGEDRHSGYEVEGKPEGAYIIVDDLIDSGSTVRAIVAAMQAAYDTPPTCAGFYGYGEAWWTWGLFPKWQRTFDELRLLPLNPGMKDMRPTLNIPRGAGKTEALTSVAL